MKPLWTTPNNDIEILEATKAAASNYGFGYGSSLMGLKSEHIKALKKGKMLAWNDGEYTTFVVLGGLNERINY